MSTAILIALALALGGLLWRLAGRAGVGRLDALGPEELAVLDKANRLSKSDPAAARQVLDEFYAKDGEREDAERAQLRERARTDLTAAEELQRRFSEDLEVWAALLRNSRKRAKKDPDARKAVANLEQWDRETRVELEQLRNHVRQLKA